MNRREFLERTTLLLASAASGPLQANSGKPEFLIASENYNKREVTYWNPRDKALIARIADIIIPRDDRPGAVDAGVPTYIELMVFEWLQESERNLFLSGLSDLREMSIDQYSQDVETISHPQLLALLEEMEERAKDSDWYDTLPINRDSISDAPFICQVKELCVWGFYNSEIGGKQVLQFDMMPMEFDGDRTLDPDESSWVADLFP